ncbi:hypothetical protein JTE90_022346 [Oedothorax gibbosus]|uniref:C3H1-type domain-containing protein n=1 Tax=Oedothorax gibbosus TaxID=931172 RepID=A0AAV6VYV4_9ARAC|nr:hypothetical protein JTE90_022346 [Oedothorax gibbosus]
MLKTSTPRIALQAKSTLKKRRSITRVIPRTPIKQFYKTRRNYFKTKSQNQKHKIRHCKGLMHFNRSYQKSFTQQNHLRKQVMSTPISKVLANRVLHRSINRVLTASVKRELKKSSKVNTYCMFYNRFGRCNKGLKCVYVHDPSKIAVCTRFLRGTCKNEKCLFSHEINPGKMAICSFFLLGSCTKTECPYRHETLSADAQLCKAFVQGYCPDGKQCKKAHVLVCPKYIQGSCDKGNACAFPHPPQKEKKNFPKPVEKTETSVETEDFMEKVSRYFQPASGQDTKTFETTVVPKRQIIPEQPSFIAL